jgi:DNA-binding LacI/PurR family transcriptional regulator
LARRPKLQEVANLAGVSIGTASHALNNKRMVSPETRERVIQAATELGYKLPGVPQSSTFSRIKVLGALVKLTHALNPPIDAFSSYLLSSAERECHKRHISLLYAGVEVDANSVAQAWPSMLKDKQFDGLLIIGTFLQETILKIAEKTDKPIVLVDGYAPANYFDRVLTDNLEGAFNAVSYLIQKGHRRIGLIGSNANSYPSIRDRREGYLRALQTNGITESYIQESTLDSVAAYDATILLLRRCPEITAIFVCNDDTARGVVHAAHDLGRHIPGDLSLIGFDDLDPIAEMLSLTTMKIDISFMGAIGVRMLIDRIQNPDHVPMTALLGTRLVERQSVREFQGVSPVYKT